MFQTDQELGPTGYKKQKEEERSFKIVIKEVKKKERKKEMKREK